MWNNILLGFIFVVILIQLVVTTKEYILNNAKYKLTEHKYSTFLWKVECALRDFVLAYDDQQPERLLGAYHEADELLQSIEKARKQLKMPAIDIILGALLDTQEMIDATATDTQN